MNKRKFPSNQPDQKLWTAKEINDINTKRLSKSFLIMTESNSIRNECAFCFAASPTNKCSTCKVKYCNLVCQRTHWKQHKFTCKSTLQLKEIIKESGYTISLYYNCLRAIAESSLNGSDFIGKQIISQRTKEGMNIILHSKSPEIIGSYMNLNSSSFARHFLMSSCLNVNALPLFLLDVLHGITLRGSQNKNNIQFVVFTPEDWMKLLEIQDKSSKLTEMKSTSPIMVTLTSKENGLVQHEEEKISTIMLNDIKHEQRVIYIIRLTNISPTKICPKKTTYMSSADASKIDDMALMVHNNLTAEPLVSDDHTIAILLNRTEGFIVQSYAGFYTSNQWLDFENKLVRNSDFPSPKHPDFLSLRALDANPKYRGMLDEKALLNLSSDIDSLALPKPDMKKYTNITGISLDTKLIGEYSVVIYRVIL